MLNVLMVARSGQSVQDTIEGDGVTRDYLAAHALLGDIPVKRDRKGYIVGPGRIVDAVAFGE